MKFLILTVCAVFAAAKPHVYLYDGGIGMPIDVNGRLIDRPEVAQAKAAHLTSRRYVSDGDQNYPSLAAPLSEDGRVVDTPEVARLKAERLVALERANAEANNAEAARPVHEKPKVVNVAPFTAAQLQEVPIFILANPGIVSSSGRGYNPRKILVDQYDQLVEAAEVARINAQYLATLAKSQAKSAGTTSSASSLPAEFSYQSQAAQQTQTQYVNLAAPIGASSSQFHPDGSTFANHQISSSSPFDGYSYEAQAAQQAQGFLVTNPEALNKPDCTVNPTPNDRYISSLAQAKPQYSNFAATSSSLSSSEGHSYGVPAIQQTQGNPFTKPIANEPQYTNFPAPIGEHVNFVPQANPQDANFVAASSSSSSSEGHSYGVPAIQQTPGNPFTKPIVNEPQYTNFPAPIGEHVNFVTQANPQGANFAAASSSSSSSEGHSYGVPTIQQTQGNPVIKPIVNEPQYTNFPAPIGEHVNFVPQANPQGANFAAPPSPSEGYSHVATVAHPSQNFRPIKVGIAQPHYTGPPAPIGEDGRVIDTEEVAKLKSEHLATLAQANAEALALAAKTSSSTTSEEYSYEEPTTQQTQEFAFTKPVVNALQSTNQYNPQAANFAATSSSSSSSEGYSYGPPAIQQTPENPVATPVAPQPQYTNLPTPVGEHVTFLPQSEPQGVPLAPTSSSSSSFEGYHYEAPRDNQEFVSIKPTIPQPANNLSSPPDGHSYQETTVQQSQGSSFIEPAAFEVQHNGSPAPIDERVTPFAPALPQSATPTSTSSSTFEGHSYGLPVAQENRAFNFTESVSARPEYTGPPAPIGQDGRVIDTPEVAQVKNNHLAILARANAQAVASALAESAASSSSAPETSRAASAAIRQNDSGHQQQTFAIADAPATAEARKTYASPVERESYDREFIDTSAAARSKIQYVAEANEKAETSGATASSSPSSSSFPSSPDQITHPAEVNQEAHVFVPPASVEKPKGYYGNSKKISLESEPQRFDTPTTSRTFRARESNKPFDRAEATVQPANFPIHGIKPIPSVVPFVPETKPLREGSQRRFVQRVIRRRPIYDGPLAPLDSTGRVIDTEEVAALKAERLATLEQATSKAIELANAVKASKAINDRTITY